MARCFSGINCEALCCGSCNVSNDKALAMFPPGKVLSIVTTADYLELAVRRTDKPQAGEISAISVRGGIMNTIIQK